ncbi:MAG TPA: serine hydrolase [Chthoniobacteraceae bacterium]|jgi:beta-lactamase class A|nr:beta-lactamase [Chthoniobacter sp.]HEV7867978.1 serine hydrolase [Chthoniobacteraceae bacterium]
MPSSRLILRIQEIASRTNLTSVAVSFYDYETTVHFSFHAERAFHAASTIKVPFMLAVFRAVDEGKLKLESRLHVRNRFRSIVDGSTFRVSSQRDGDADIYKQRGHAVPISELVKAMIVRSSNLATNLLFDYLGRDYIRGVIEEARLAGIRVERGVEDEVAFAQGLNNEVSAGGLLNLFRLLCERQFLSEKSCQQMIDVLLGQEFNRMIPAKLPDNARVAHKTGEISTICHDAGIVYLPDRQPYIVVILTESGPGQEHRQKAVASISSAVFHYLTGTVKRDE